MGQAAASRPPAVPGKVSVVSLVNGWCPAQNIACERARRAATACGDGVEFTLLDTSDPATFEEWGMADALFIDGQAVRFGPPPKFEALRRRIAKRLAGAPPRASRSRSVAAARAETERRLEASDGRGALAKLDARGSKVRGEFVNAGSESLLHRRVGAHAVLPPPALDAEDLRLLVEHRLDARYETIAIEDRQHVIAIRARLLRLVDLPAVVEVEDLS